MPGEYLKPDVDDTIPRIALEEIRIDEKEKSEKTFREKYNGLGES